MNALTFGFDRSARGDKPVTHVVVDGLRTQIFGPVICRSKANDELWRHRLADQARRLQEGARHDLILRRPFDGVYQVYDCPAT